MTETTATPQALRVEIATKFLSGNFHPEGPVALREDVFQLLVVLPGGSKESHGGWRFLRPAGLGIGDYETLLSQHCEKYHGIYRISSWGSSWDTWDIWDI
eukprot:gene971-biopygen1141